MPEIPWLTEDKMSNGWKEVQLRRCEKFQTFCLNIIWTETPFIFTPCYLKGVNLSRFGCCISKILRIKMLKRWMNPAETSTLLLCLPVWGSSWWVRSLSSCFSPSSARSAANRGEAGSEDVPLMVSKVALLWTHWTHPLYHTYPHFFNQEIFWEVNGLWERNIHLSLWVKVLVA